MARTMVDVSVFSEKWFVAILEELIACKHVIFAYSPTKKFLGEHERARKLQQFYKVMGDKGRRVDAEVEACETHEEWLIKLRAWKDEPACDDEHIFALVYEKPTKFVFTSDGRIAKCRTCLRKVVESRYCAFSLISSEANYENHRAAILAP